MNPKHSNPTKKERFAYAPYNFIPLPEKVVLAESIPDQDCYHSDRFTGYLECTLTTLSPLYTRCALNPEFFRHWADKVRDLMKDDQAREEYSCFFSINDAKQPVIPGSTLRGMVRTLVEIIGYGKVQWVNGNKLVYRAVGDPSSLGQFYREQLLGPNKSKPPNIFLEYPSRSVKGGYLEKSQDRWVIRPAREYHNESFIHVEYNDVAKIISGCDTQKVYDVYVKPVPRQPSNRGKRGKGVLILNIAITPKVEPRTSSQPPPDMVPAKLIKSGHMGGKHPKHWHCAIYEPNPSAKLISIPDHIWATYKEDSEYPRGLPTRKLENGSPLFYLLDEEEQLIFLGPTMMFRLPYPYTPYEMIPERLRREEDLDLAEAIFGYAKSNALPEGKERTYGGRVFFTDAKLISPKNGIWLSSNAIIPKVLASPKPTTFPHYLVQDKSRSHDPDDKKQLAYYDKSSENNTVIRGYKLYWHRGQVDVNDIKEPDSVNWLTDTQHTSVKPLKSGITFSFKIFFENLSKIELGALLWALSLPGEPGKEYYHKLGMGKPLGMGAVKIMPTLYISDRKNRYTRLFDGEFWYCAERQKQDIDCFIEAFKEYILKEMNQNERARSQSLKDVERIKMLLKMLEWPGPPPNLTRYLKIEPENEYRDRRVLPDPLNINPDNASLTK